jgi:hypothetical protein
MQENFYYETSTMVVSLSEPLFYGYTYDIITMDDYIHFYRHEHGGYLEHITQPFIKIRCHQLGVSVST